MLYNIDVCQSWYIPDKIALGYFRTCIITHNNNLFNKTSMYSRSKFCPQKNPHTILCNWIAVFEYSKAHWSKPVALENFKMATRVRNRPIVHCKPLSIEYVMYVYGLCLLFDFATKNLHLATLFYHLVAKWQLNNFFFERH